MEPEKMIEEFKDLPSDEEKWHWVHKHAQEVTIILDNDETYLTHDSDMDNELDTGKFSESIGNSPGIPALLESMNIHSEKC